MRRGAHSGALQRARRGLLSSCPRGSPPCGIAAASHSGGVTCHTALAGAGTSTNQHCSCLSVTVDSHGHSCPGCSARPLRGRPSTRRRMAMHARCMAMWPRRLPPRAADGGPLRRRRDLDSSVHFFYSLQIFIVMVRARGRAIRHARRPVTELVDDPSHGGVMARAHAPLPARSDTRPWPCICERPIDWYYIKF